MTKVATKAVVVNGINLSEVLFPLRLHVTADHNVLMEDICFRLV